MKQYAKDAREVLQKIEQEHFQHGPSQGHSSLFSMLNQPYCPPPMVFEKKPAVPKERAILTKAAAMSSSSTKAQTLQVVREAMKMTEEKFKTQLDGKDQLIQRQQECLIEQKRQILEMQSASRDPNVI